MSTVRELNERYRGLLHDETGPLKASSRVNGRKALDRRDAEIGELLLAPKDRRLGLGLSLARRGNAPKLVAFCPARSCASQWWLVLPSHQPGTCSSTAACEHT